MDNPLDPVFLHLPRLTEKQFRYTGLGTRKTNILNPASALPLRILLSRGAISTGLQSRVIQACRFLANPVSVVL